MDPELINTIESSVEDLPEEARDFIFGEDFEAASAELSALVANENEKKDLSSQVMLFLFGTITKEDLLSYVESLSTTPENKLAIAKIIDEKIINELLLTIDVNKEIDEEAGLNQESTEEKKPSTSLSTLSDRLKIASIATPSKRDYSLDKPAASAPAAPTPPRAIDPYHESIDNE